jgi:hypothetical protein
VPCAIQAAADGVLSEKTPVTGAPANCGINGGTPLLQQNQEQEREDSTQQRRRRTNR